MATKTLKFRATTLEKLEALEKKTKIKKSKLVDIALRNLLKNELDNIFKIIIDSDFDQKRVIKTFYLSDSVVKSLKKASENSHIGMSIIADVAIVLLSEVEDLFKLIKEA